MASPSHKNVAVPLMLGLADRGHNVTVASSFKTEEHKNVRDILVHQNFEYFPGMNALDMRRKGPLGMLSMNDTHFIEYCHATYRNTEFMRLLNESFDLVYMDAFANDCLLGFIHKLGAPFIVISSLPVPGEISMYTGNRLPLSFVPHWLVPFGHRMTFLERIINVFISTLSTLGMADGMRNNERVYREELGQDLPGGYEIAGNVSMILVNSHFSFNFPRPTLPDVVEVGAIHCRPGKPLPQVCFRRSYFKVEILLSTWNTFHPAGFRKLFDRRRAWLHTLQPWVHCTSTRNARSNSQSLRQCILPLKAASFVEMAQRNARSPI